MKNIELITILEGAACTVTAQQYEKAYNDFELQIADFVDSTTDYKVVYRYLSDLHITLSTLKEEAVKNRAKKKCALAFVH